jgi:hypothetical protein
VEICDTVSDLLSQAGCTAGEACDVESQSTIACRSAGVTPDYSPCTEATDCLAGATCASVGASERCLPFCALAELGQTGSCPDGGVCLWQHTTTVGPVGLCARPDACDVPAQTGCASGTACYVVYGFTFCLPTGTRLASASCQPLVQECIPGYYCTGTCQRACHDSGDCTLQECTGDTGLAGTGYCQ